MMPGLRFGRHAGIGSAAISPPDLRPFLTCRPKVFLNGARCATTGLCKALSGCKPIQFGATKLIQIVE